MLEVQILIHGLILQVIVNLEHIPGQHSTMEVLQVATLTEEVVQHHLLDIAVLQAAVAAVEVVIILVTQDVHLKVLAADRKDHIHLLQVAAQDLHQVAEVLQVVVLQVAVLHLVQEEGAKSIKNSKFV